MIRKINFRLFAGMALTALVLSSCGLSRMVKNYNQVKYEVEPQVLEAHGGKAAVQVKGQIPPKYFHRRATITFTPVLEFQGGESKLKSATLKGEKSTVTGTTISRKTGGNFTWNDVITYEPSMNASQLMARATATLRKKTVDLGTVKLADGIINTSSRYTHDEPVMEANRETAKKLGMDLSEYYEKETIISKKANIYFVVDRYDLNLRHELNKNAAAVQALADLKAFMDQEWVIRDISINAWASPEGEESRNQGLSENRSKTAKKYIDDYFKKWQADKAKATKKRLRDVSIPAVTFNIKALGEDWDGFMRAVEQSQIKDKNIILNVVRSQADVKRREQEIRNMTVIYKEIEDAILPPLRRAEITVNSFEPKRTDAQIATLSTSHPDSLTLKELIYAGELTSDLNTKQAIYEAAVRLHPQDWKAYANLGYVFLSNGQLDKAGSYLDRANTLSPNNPIVLNNLGALAAKNGDDAAARSFYKQAQGKGVSVDYQLGILSIKDGDYAAALKSFGNTKCNYNVALAQVLSKDLTNAATNLRCAPENAQVFYLLAIVGARSNDSNMVYDNLKKAIASDASYKAQAATDREFLRFFDKAEFQAIVK